MRTFRLVLGLGLGVLLAAALCGCGASERLDAGDILFDKGEYAKAIEAWRASVREEPENTGLLIRIATAQVRLKRFEEAEATMLRAVAIAPKSPKVRQNLALVYLRKKDLDKALATFHQVRDLQKTVILSAEIVESDGNRFVEVSRIGDGFGEGIRVDLVELQIQVFDSHDVPVTGLDRQNFSVFEDGQEIRIDGVGTLEDQPLSLVIAVDSSSSMITDFPKIRRAVAGFADGLLAPGDRTALIRFASNSEVLISWSENPEDIRRGLAEVYPRGSTSLNDAIIQSLMQIHGRRGRKAVVLLTDGADTSSFSSFRDTKWLANSMRIPIFVITLAPGDAHRYAKMRDIGDVQDRHRMVSLAKETGGRAFFQITYDHLPSVYNEISEILRSQYVLWYRPDPNKALDTFRSITVRVDKPKLKVRTISGYYPGR